MECKFDIKVKGIDGSGKILPPCVIFRIIQLNMTENCITEGHIDEQINSLIKKVEELRKKAKKELKTAKLEYNKRLLERK